MVQGSRSHDAFACRNEEVQSLQCVSTDLGVVAIYNSNKQEPAVVKFEEF